MTGIAIQCTISTCNANSVASAGISWGVTAGATGYCSMALAGGPATSFVCFLGGATLGYLSGKLFNLGYQLSIGNTKMQVQIPQSASATVPTIPESTIIPSLGKPMPIYQTNLDISVSKLLPKATQPVSLMCTNLQTCLGLLRVNYVTLQNAYGYPMVETTANYNQPTPAITANSPGYYYQLYFHFNGGIGDSPSNTLSAYWGAMGNCPSGIILGNDCVALSVAKEKVTIMQASTTPTGDVPVTTYDINSLSDLINSLPPEKLNEKVDPQLLADIANGLWKQASERPDYEGLPYPSTDPLTAPQVSAAAATQPGGMPRVGDALAPASKPNSLALPDPVSGAVIDPNTGKATDPNTGKATDPNPVKVPDSTVVVKDGNGNVEVTVNNNVEVDWGQGNGITGQLTEETPEMSSILDPIFSLVKPWTDFKLATHGSSCPVYSFNMFNKDFSVDAVCELIEPNKNSIGTAMLLVFSMIAIFIILGA